METRTWKYHTENGHGDGDIKTSMETWRHAWRHEDMHGDIKQKTEDQSIFLNTFTVNSSCKRKFVVCSRRNKRKFIVYSRTNKRKLSVCKRTKRTCPSMPKLCIVKVGIFVKPWAQNDYRVNRFLEITHYPRCPLFNFNYLSVIYNWRLYLSDFIYWLFNFPPGLQGLLL
jgi:hypothetical protein